MLPHTNSNREPTDYKSIALPAELQGLLFSCEVFTAKDQLNQCIKNNVSVRCLLATHFNCDSISSFVTNLSAWSRYGNPDSDFRKSYQNVLIKQTLNELCLQHLRLSKNLVF